MTRIRLALIVYNPGEDRGGVVSSAAKCGLAPICCSNLREARILLPQEDFEMVFCGDLLSDGDFQSVLREVKKLHPLTPVIVLSRSTNWNFYLKALGLGAFDYIVCPPNPAEAERIIWAALPDRLRSPAASNAAA